MEILKRLVRSHFEQTGKFGTTPFDDMLTSKSASLGVSSEELYYNLLGYKADDEMSAKDRYTYKSLFLRGKTKALYKIFEVSTNVKLLDKMKKLDIVPANSIPKKMATDVPPEYHALIRLLAEYLTNNREVAVHVKEEAIAASELIKKYRYVTKRKQFFDLMNSPTIERIIELSAPIPVQKDDCEGLVVQGYLFYKKQLSAEEVKLLMVEAMAHALSSKLDVPLAVYLYCVDNVLTYHDSDNDKYQELLDYAISLGVTVKEMFELCGLKYVNVLEYFETTKCVFYLQTLDTFRVYSLNSVTANDNVVLDQNTIEELYKKDLLKTLNWEKGRPYVYTGQKKFFNVAQ